MAWFLRRTLLGVVFLTFSRPWVVEAVVEAQPPTTQPPTAQSAGVSVELEKAMAWRER